MVKQPSIGLVESASLSSEENARATMKNDRSSINDEDFLGQTVQQLGDAFSSIRGWATSPTTKEAASVFIERCKDKELVQGIASAIREAPDENAWSPSVP